MIPETSGKTLVFLSGKFFCPLPHREGGSRGSPQTALAYNILIFLSACSRGSSLAPNGVPRLRVAQNVLVFKKFGRKFSPKNWLFSYFGPHYHLHQGSGWFWFVLHFLSPQGLHFHVPIISLGQWRRMLGWIMYLKYTIFIQNGLCIIDFFSTIGSTIFNLISFDPSFQDKDFDVSYASLALKVLLGHKVL